MRKCNINIKILILAVLVAIILYTIVYKSTPVINIVKLNIFQENKISSFDYKSFADNMATQAKSLIPNDISKKNRAYIVEKIRKNTYLSGEALVKDSDHSFSDEQIMFISQVIAEWTFHKSIDLVRSGIPSQYWDDMIQKIAFTTFEVTKQGIIKSIPQDQLLQAIEYHINKVYNASIEKLDKEGAIDKEIRNRAKSQSNIDAMAKELPHKD